MVGVTMAAMFYRHALGGAKDTPQQLSGLCSGIVSSFPSFLRREPIHKSFSEGLAHNSVMASGSLGFTV